MKIVFAGTPEFAQIQLKALLETGHEIVAVYTQPDRPAGRGRQTQSSPVKQLALLHHIPVEQPATLKDSQEQAKLAAYQPDVMVVAAYGLLLPQAVLDIPRYGCLNVHASLLPRWRGASPIQQAILAGDPQSGITLMQMDKGLDTGNMLVKASLDIAADDTGQRLHDKLAQLGADLLTQAFTDPNFFASLKPEIQDNAHMTHAPKISKEDAHIHWNSQAIVIERLIRAYHPWPRAYSFIDGQQIHIDKALVVNISHQKEPGTILGFEANGEKGLLIACQPNQALLLLAGQLPGKKAMSFTQIVNGHQLLLAQGKCLDP